ncbi:hypothetical protein FI667_g12018, partial [Globisporangium splendens]
MSKTEHHDVSDTVNALSTFWTLDINVPNSHKRKKSRRSENERHQCTRGRSRVCVAAIAPGGEAVVAASTHVRGCRVPVRRAVPARSAAPHRPAKSASLSTMRVHRIGQSHEPHESSGAVDKYYKAFQFNNGLVSAVQHGNLEMVQWLCQVYCPTMGFATKAMIEAVKMGNLRIAEWLAGHREDITWSSSMVDEAASRGHLEILKWLHSHPRSRGCIADQSWGSLCNAVYAGHLKVAQFLFQHQYILNISYTRDYTEWCGDFAMIKWLHESSLLGWADDALRQAVAQGRLDVAQRIYNNCTEG